MRFIIAAQLILSVSSRVGADKKEEENRNKKSRIIGGSPAIPGRCPYFVNINV
jgi:hypothetical protein